MPRTHYSEGQIQDCLELYRHLESTGHHRRKGVKDHMASILSYSGIVLYRNDVNKILDILKERGSVGDHHVVAQLQEPLREAGRGFHAAVAKNQLLENIRTFKGQKTITPGLHKILAIPDTHASVSLSNERFSWAGRLAAERRPDLIVQIGDWTNWDCVSGHEKPGTMKFAKKPTFEQEFAVFADSVRKFEAELPKKYKPRKHVTFGNHEQRCYDWENYNPVAHRTLTARVEQVFESAGWGWAPYGAKVYLEGVMFTHKPFNTMGKPEGMATVKREAMCDIYTGHDHRRFEETVPKHDDAVTIISGGCFMPDGYLPHYAEHALTGWWYGCQILTVENGHIRETEWISMKTLEEKYGG